MSRIHHSGISCIGLRNMTKVENMPDKTSHVSFDALEAQREDRLRRLSREFSGMSELLLRRDLTARYEFEDI